MTKEASPLRGNMNKYMDTLLKSSLFSSITADDVDSVLDCLGAIIKKYQKNECILMAGNTTEYIGLLLTGKAIVIQEDYWSRSLKYNSTKLASVISQLLAFCR